MKKNLILLFLVLMASGCTPAKEIIVEDAREEANTSVVNIPYFYSNEITDPNTSEKYFVRRDKGMSQCAIIGSTTPKTKECALSPYSNAKIGICGQDRMDNDPTVCELMVKHHDGSLELVANLIKPDYVEEAKSFYEDYYSGGITTGAELIEFEAPDKIIMFFGYDFSDSHRGTIAYFDLKTKKLGKPVVDYYRTGDISFFGIEKDSKQLIFINDIISPNYEAITYEGIKENGIYLKTESNVKKVDFPGNYDFSLMPFVDLKVRENYQNGSFAVISVHNKNYAFDFENELFIE
ncbi:hypothetical protein K8R32_03825 [bacterium]|nr:hypothetical protein [bacterium]